MYLTRWVHDGCVQLISLVSSTWCFFGGPPGVQQDGAEGKSEAVLGAQSCELDEKLVAALAHEVRLCIVVLACEHHRKKTFSGARIVNGPPSCRALTPHLQFGLKASNTALTYMPLCSNQSALVCCPRPSLDTCRTSDVRQSARRNTAFSFHAQCWSGLNTMLLLAKL